MKALRPLLLFVAGLVLLLSGIAAAVVLRPAPPPAAVRQARPPTDDDLCTRRRPCLAVVIDDVGRDPRALGRLLALPADLTFAVLPHAPMRDDALGQLERAGREVLLHLPMAPSDPRHITDEPVVLSAGGPLRLALAECLQRVPHAVGINNHMGSALSEDVRALRVLAAEVRSRGLFLLDSRTSPRSLICQIAAASSVPCVGRDVFLDDPSDPGTMEHWLMVAKQQARRRGWAVAIGHPLAATDEALEHLLTVDRAQQVPVVRLSRVMSRIGDGP